VSCWEEGIGREVGFWLRGLKMPDVAVPDKAMLGAGDLLVKCMIHAAPERSHWAVPLCTDSWEATCRQGRTNPRGVRSVRPSNFTQEYGVSQLYTQKGANKGMNTAVAR